MKNSQNLHALQADKRKKEEELWVLPKPCHICKKIIAGAYGQTTLAIGLIWSCSKVCEQEVQLMKGKEYASLSSTHNTQAKD